MPSARASHAPASPAVRLARWVLSAFLFTFLASRVLVLLIMSRRLPDLYAHTRGGTHVHHLNYGIFLLAGVGAALLFFRPSGSWLNLTAVLYGAGLGLTFDEFGMWLHLTTTYWQKSDFDAVIAIAALLSLVAAAPSIKRFGARHWTIAALLVLGILLFAAVLMDTARSVGQRLGPVFQEMEQRGPR